MSYLFFLCYKCIKRRDYSEIFSVYLNGSPYNNLITLKLILKQNT